MAKSDDDGDEVVELVEELVCDLASDRERLSGFLDRIIAFDDPHMIAEAVAKLSDALTRQTHLRIGVIKARLKAKPSDKDGKRAAEVFDEIGRPFQEDGEGGSN